MKVFTVRVLVDSTDEEDVFRDILIAENHTFLDLHNIIQDAFEFDNSQMASFYLSDDDWERGEEIMLMDMGAKGRMMSDTRIGEFMNEVGDKFIYLFDFMLMWAFFVEVVKREEGFLEDPSIVIAIGEAPGQYSKEPADLFGAMAPMDFDMDADEDDDEDGEDDDPFGFKEFGG